MTTAWKSKTNNNGNNDNNDRNPTNKITSEAISGTALSCWSRQQKLAMIAGFAILGLLLAVSACSKQSPKPTLAGVSSPAPSPVTATAAAAPVAVAASAIPPSPAKKTPRKRPANVIYSDANSGVSFLYPRKFALTSGDKTQPRLPEMGEVPMNFVQPGGATVVTVELPDSLYPGTDFASAFFSVNLNRNLSEQECKHFAFVDTSNADGEPIDAEKVNVGSTDMEMTSDFSGSAMKQAETQYYHSYANGACYEYVLGLGTAGYGAKDGIEPVDRDEVFARLEKILATVKIKPAAQEHVTEPVAEPAATGISSGRE